MDGPGLRAHKASLVSHAPPLGMVFEKYPEREEFNTFDHIELQVVAAAVQYFEQGT
jgi:hypothetical protein